tara:strand:- start:608 stop:1099 length:492 start_codon:yes stop_codon:yes gene_type:complete
MPITINGNGTITGVTEGLNRPAFRVSLNTTTNVANNTNVIVPFNVVDIDTDNCFNTTNYRVTPNLAGFYVVFANVTVATASRPNLEDAQLSIFKNTTIIAFAEIDPSDTGEEGSLTNQTGTIVEMNGTSDFFQVKVNIDRQTSSPQIVGGNRQSFFYGYKLNI